MAGLRAHRQHRRSARGEQQREQIAHVARARRLDRGIVARALDAVVPGLIVVRAVAIVLAVGLVVLARVGDEIGEREAVVRDDEIDAFRRGGRVRENIARAGEARRDFAAQTARRRARSGARVAEAIVPFAPALGKPAELIAARADVPGFGDQLGSR